MLSLIGALVVAAGLIAFSAILVFFRRANAPSFTRNDDIGSYVAFVLVSVLALGVAIFAEGYTDAGLWHFAAGIGAIAVGLIGFVFAILRINGSSPTGTTAPVLPPPLSVDQRRKTRARKPRSASAARRKAA